MTLPPPDQDNALDRRIRAAALVPFDDIAVTEAVLARIHTERRERHSERRLGRVVRVGPAAFAALLLATPFMVARLPPAGFDEDALLIGLATGDPAALFGGANLDEVME